LPQAHKELAAQVGQLFRGKCVNCHGSDVVKPKGGFGYVTDLVRLRNNRDLVASKDLDGSDLWFLIETDQMPPEDSGIQPLTVEEKRLISDWILAGAPAPTPSATIAEETTASSGVDRSVSVGEWLGRFHPAVVHIPIGLLLAGGVAAGLDWRMGRSSFRAIMRYCAWFAAAGSTVSVGLGWLQARAGVFVGARADVVEWHRWIGVAVGTLSWAAVALAEADAGVPSRRRRSYLRAALILGAVVAIVAGFQGGRITHGLDHYYW
jgi:uncharacterized membrane protein